MAVFELLVLEVKSIDIDMPEEAFAEGVLTLLFELSHKETPLIDGANRAWCWKEKFLPE